MTTSTHAHTTVKSDLARAEVLDDAAPRCASTWTLQQDFSDMGMPRGTVLRCTRPASRHRVHEAAGFIQWGTK